MLSLVERVKLGRMRTNHIIGISSNEFIHILLLEINSQGLLDVTNRTHNTNVITDVMRRSHQGLLEIKVFCFK